MSKSELERIELTKRLPKDEDFWYNNLMGIILTATFITPFIFIAFDNWIGVSILTYAAVILSLGFIIYAYWLDMNVSFIETKQSKKENFKLVTDNLRELKWEFHRTGDHVRLWTPNQAFLLRQIVDAEIFIYDGKIGYAFRYSPTTRTGRLIFAFGFRTYLKKKFERKLRATMDIRNLQLAKSIVGDEWRADKNIAD